MADWLEESLLYKVSEPFWGQVRVCFGGKRKSEGREILTFSDLLCYFGAEKTMAGKCF